MGVQAILLGWIKGGVDVSVNDNSFVPAALLIVIGVLVAGLTGSICYNAGVNDAIKGVTGGKYVVVTNVTYVLKATPQ